MSKRQLVENRYTFALEEAGCTMYHGWDNQLAEQLATSSREPRMMQDVPHDYTERFADEVASEKWYESTHRHIYTIGRQAVVGVIWYSYRPRDELATDYTFAIRMYEPARGQHLALPFMRASQYDFENSQRHEGRVWLETDYGNNVARKLYEKAGFILASERGDRVVMVRNAEEHAN